MSTDRKVLKKYSFDKNNFSEIKFQILKLIAWFRQKEYLNLWQMIIEHLRFTRYFFLPKSSWKFELPINIIKMLLASKSEYKPHKNDRYS